jgi:DNA-binding NarL/FixJ family response regulator
VTNTNTTPIININKDKEPELKPVEKVNIIPLEQAMANQAKAEQVKAVKPVVEEPEEVTEVENVIVEMKPEAKVNTVSAFSVVAAENKDEENVEIIEIADNAQDTTQQPENNNDRILQMHKEGMSNVDIAKELGLGVGEVKLVINLFKGAM